MGACTSDSNKILKPNNMYANNISGNQNAFQAIGPHNLHTVNFKNSPNQNNIGLSSINNQMINNIKMQGNGKIKFIFKLVQILQILQVI